jgi:hypothetical protein
MLHGLVDRTAIELRRPALQLELEVAVRGALGLIFE